MVTRGHPFTESVRRKYRRVRVYSPGGRKKGCRDDNKQHGAAKPSPKLVYTGLSFVASRPKFSRIFADTRSKSKRADFFRAVKKATRPAIGFRIASSIQWARAG